MKEQDLFRKPRILVVNRYENGEEKRAAATARFRKMVDALKLGGLESDQCAPPTLPRYMHALDSYRPDLVFCSFFRFGGSDGEGYLRDFAIQSGIGWIGSSSDIMELALSKSRLKARWRVGEIPTPDWFVVRRYSDGSIDGLEQMESARNYPYIVKPANEGNSRGIDDHSVVHSSIELYARATFVAERYGEALVERYVAGGPDSREFTVAMIGNGPRALLGAIEIKKAKPESVVVSEEDKEGQTTQVLPVEDCKLKEKIERLAQKVFMTSGARDYARCDILLHEGKLYAIEMNGQPMVPDRWFEACSREMGLDEVQYLNAIIVSGIIGNAQTGHAYITIPREMAKLVPLDIMERLSRV